MKKFIIALIAVFSLLSYSASAFTVEVVNLAEIYEPSDWAETEVNKALENGLINDEDGIFYRDDINREQFAELITVCVDKLVDTSSVEKAAAFVDSDNEQVLRAAAMGIVAGVGDNKFAPTQKITRQEIAAMMHRAIKYVESAKGTSYLNANSDISKFEDADKVSDWAKESVGTLVNNQIIFGTSDTEISPLDNTTIEQAILLDVRIFDLMK